MLGMDDGKNKSREHNSGSLRTVLQHSDWKDAVLMAIGSIGSVADGSAMAFIIAS